MNEMSALHGTALEDAGVLMARLRSTFDGGRTRDIAWRKAQIGGLLRLIAERRVELTAALQRDLRRSGLDAAMLDIAPTKSAARHAIKHLDRWMKPLRVSPGVAAMPGKAWVQYEPLGVVLVIAPWNYPIHLALGPMVAAYAAGNAIALKPSEMTPACSALMAQLLPLYVDPDAIAVVEGGPEATQALIAQGFDHCFFTGSPAVGKAVMRAAAEHLTPVTLELGGKCPAVVTASADLAVAARRIAWGKLANSGQTCIAPDYVLVDATVRDAFLDHLAGTIATFCENMPQPVINTRHAGRLAVLLRECGGQILTGGTIDIEGAWAEPTVVVDPDPRSALMQEEIFGPILPVVTYQAFDDAIAHIRAGSRPLASYLFSRDSHQEKRFLAEVVTGGAVINHVLLHLAVPDLPFGGVGTSGTGRYHGRWGFETFSNAKAVLRKRFWPDPSLIYPPYTGWKRKLLERA